MIMTIDEAIAHAKEVANKTCVIYTIRPDICRNYRCWDSDVKRADKMIARHTYRVVHAGCEFYGKRL